MRVTTLRSEPFTANVHVVDCGERALVVDAGTGVDWGTFEPTFRKVVDPRKVAAIHLTHWHCDHAGGAARLARLTGAPVHAHAAEADALERGDSRATLGAWAGIPQEPCACQRVKEGDAIVVGDSEFRVLEVPGHSPGSTALWEPVTRSLFSGDLVFAEGAFGRVDFPGGDAEKLLDSLERVAGMDVERLYAGHMASVERGASKAIARSLDTAKEMLA